MGWLINHKNRIFTLKSKKWRFNAFSQPQLPKTLSNGQPLMAIRRAIFRAGCAVVQQWERGGLPMNNMGIQESTRKLAAKAPEKQRHFRGWELFSFREGYLYKYRWQPQLKDKFRGAHVFFQSEQSAQKYSSLVTNEPRTKHPLTFNYTVCLIVILMMVYYHPHVTW